MTVGEIVTAIVTGMGLVMLGLSFVCPQPVVFVMGLFCVAVLCDGEDG